MRTTGRRQICHIASLSMEFIEIKGMGEERRIQREREREKKRETERNRKLPPQRNGRKEESSSRQSLSLKRTGTVCLASMHDAGCSMGYTGPGSQGAGSSCVSILTSFVPSFLFIKKVRN